MILTKSFTYRGNEVSYDDLKPHSVLPVMVQCDHCGTVFKTTKYQLVRNGHELCRPCALKVKRGKLLPVNMRVGRLTVIGPSERTGYSICRCSCGNIKEVSNDALQRGTTRSCGCLRSENAKRITAEHLSLYQKGENNWNWKGGITNERDRMASTKEYKMTRESVMNRDGHKCRVCGSADKLHVHHLRNYVDNPSLFLDSSNMVTLCAICHREFHHRYGLHNTTPEQFTEFCDSCTTYRL